LTVARRCPQTGLTAFAARAHLIFRAEECNSRATLCDILPTTPYYPSPCPFLSTRRVLFQSSILASWPGHPSTGPTGEGGHAAVHRPPHLKTKDMWPQR
jgi:hypothetical protein